MIAVIAAPCVAPAVAVIVDRALATQPAGVRVVALPGEHDVRRYVERPAPADSAGPACLGLVTVQGWGAQARWFAYRVPRADPDALPLFVRVRARSTDGGYATRAAALAAVWKDP